MTVFILGFSKSGTTLAARTLHEAGIDMMPGCTGSYPACPYENWEGCKLIMDSFGIKKKKSLFLPTDVNFDPVFLKEYIDFRSRRSKEWGFKFPYLTLVYEDWKFYLPKDHIAIGCKRTPEGVLSHYTRGKKKYNKASAERIFAVKKVYDDIIDSLDIPVIWFEDFLKNGPGELEKIVGRKLPDVREARRGKKS